MSVGCPTSAVICSIFRNKVHLLHLSFRKYCIRVTMLPQKSLRPNYLAFWFCSKIQSMPFIFDRTNGKINTASRSYGWNCWLILTALHCGFITVRLIQALLFHGTQFFVEQLPFHVICVTAAIFNVYAGIASFIQWPRLNMLLFNGLYTHSEGYFLLLILILNM